MKKYLILLLISSIVFSNSKSLIDLQSNDYPIWLPFPNQSIDEDCDNGCIDGEFLFNLFDYVSDPDEDDIITIIKPPNSGGIKAFLLN